MEETTPYWVAPLIIALSTMAIIAAAVFRHLQWKDKEPHQFFFGIGYKPITWSAFQWPGFIDALNVMLDVLAAHPEFEKARETPFWIYAYGYTDDIRVPRWPTGYESLATGQSAPKPLTTEDAEKVGRIVGTMTKERKWPWSTPTYTIHVKMLRSGDSKIEGRLSTGTEPLLSFGRSEFFHEHAQHFVSDVVYGEENPNHSRADLDRLMKEMRDEYRKRFQETT